MNPITEYKQLSKMDLAVVLFFSSATAGSGLLWIWLFAPTLIDSASTAKLLILAVGSSLPFVSLSICVHAFVSNLRTADNAKGNFTVFIIGGSLVALIGSFTGLVSGLLFLASFRLSVGIALSMWAAGIVFLRVAGSLFQPSDTTMQRTTKVA